MKDLFSVVTEVGQKEEETVPLCVFRVCVTPEKGGGLSVLGWADALVVPCAGQCFSVLMLSLSEPPHHCQAGLRRVYCVRADTFCFPCKLS